VGRGLSLVLVVLAALAFAAAGQARSRTTLAGAASFGFERGLVTSSRDGVVVRAARIARLGPLIARSARGSGVSASVLEAVVFVDGRPTRRKGLRAMARSLARAGHVLGRRDLALEAHHLGVRKLKRVLAAYGRKRPSYAQLYFGSGPDRHRGTWRALASGGDYYWRVLAARRIMRLYRRHPQALAYEAHLQSRKNSAEEVMHPRPITPQFKTPNAIAAAWKRHALRAIPRDAAHTHIAVSRFLGQEAHALGRSRRLYTGLRPGALTVLLYIGERVHELSGGRKLLVTSAVRDQRYQRVLTRVNVNATRAYSMHTTGYAFDIARNYSSRRQAAAFQFVLDRLVAVGAIAYIHEYAAIHIAVASDARAKLALLDLG
jgi:hypothetical protein